MTNIRKHTAYRFTTLAMALAATATLVGVSAGSSSAATSLPSGTTPLSYAQVGTLLNRLEGKLKPVTGDTTRGVVGHTITIAGVATVDVGGVAYYPGMCDGAKARFEAANRAGGVDGYKFNYVGCSDDGDVASNNAELIQTAVQTHHAFALVPASSTAMTPQFLNKNHVPYMGFAEGTAYCGWNSTPFALSAEGELGCPIPNSGGKQLLSSFSVTSPLDYLKTAKGLAPSKVKVAIIGQDISSSVSTDNAISAIAKGLGAKVVYYQNPVPAPTAAPLSDYTPIAEAALQGGPNLVQVNVAGSPEFAVISALHAAGYKGLIYASAIDNPLVLGVPSLAAAVNGGLAINAWYGNPVSYPNKYFNQIQANLTAIGSTAPVRDYGTMWSYAQADMFIDALKATVAHMKGPLTTEKFVNTVNAGFTYPGIPNTICPAIFPQEHLSQSNCITGSIVNGAKQTDEPALPMGNYGSQYLVPYA
jgi:branched-chain amino acid transport system substrate-binding protein